MGRGFKMLRCAAWRPIHPSLTLTFTPPRLLLTLTLTLTLTHPGLSASTSSMARAAAMQLNSPRCSMWTRTSLSAPSLRAQVAQHPPLTQPSSPGSTLLTQHPPLAQPSRHRQDQHHQLRRHQRAGGEVRQEERGYPDRCRGPQDRRHHVSLMEPHHTNRSALILHHPTRQLLPLPVRDAARRKSSPHWTQERQADQR